MFKIIIDANVWVKYARVKDIAPLLGRLVQYNLLPLTNNYLLSEVSRPLQVLSPATEAGARKRDSSEYFIGGNERWAGLLCI
ncbi:MAG: hypothetical protein JWR18_1543 [Segetibacter sp.]|jgi:hypothetical protein|nr:hypothetical protein [Segetibacter sp.]